MESRRPDFGVFCRLGQFLSLWQQGSRAAPEAKQLARAGRFAIHTNNTGETGLASSPLEQTAGYSRFGLQLVCGESRSHATAPDRKENVPAAMVNVPQRNKTALNIVPLRSGEIPGREENKS